MTVIKTDCALLSGMLGMCIPPGIAHETFNRDKRFQKSHLRRRFFLSNLNSLQASCLCGRLDGCEVPKAGFNLFMAVADLSYQ